jgi:fibro-slime domain-containing protein
MSHLAPPAPSARTVDRRSAPSSCALGATLLALVAWACGAPATDAPTGLVTSPAANNPSPGNGPAGAPNGPGGVVFGTPLDTPSTGTDPNARCTANTTGLVRDFRNDHPDFEKQVISAKGIIASELGPDQKPVYVATPTPAGDDPTLHLGGTHGKAAFDQWYRSDDNVNFTIEHSLQFTPVGNGISTFSSNAFFPIDELGFGNQFLGHNFHFTFELHTTFIYNGAEVFTFSGDDDLFVFINGRLAIDLGGVHAVQTDTVMLDAIAAEFGLIPGNTYPLDLFHAERHTGESNFRIDSSLEFNNCEAILIR